MNLNYSMGKILILQGAPGSGKSTYAKEWQNEDPTNRVIICLDSFRLGRGKYWVPEQEDYIVALERFAIQKAIESNFDICLDATNMNEYKLSEIETVVHDMSFLDEQYEIEYKLFNPGLEVCIERCKKADRDHPVSEDVVRMFYKKYPKILKENV